MIRFVIYLALAMSCAQAAPLRLAFNTLAPWKIYDAQGQAAGAYTEVVRELARRLGLEFKAIDCPLKRCLALLEHGEVDVAIGLQSSGEREKYLHFLQTPYRLHASDKVFYLRRGEQGRLQRYEDLHGLTVGTRLGSEVFDRFDDDRQIRKEAVPDPAVNFRKLLLRRLDAVAIPEDQGEFLLATLQLGQQIEKAPFRQLDATPRFLAVARLSPLATRLSDFEAAMAAMRNDGTLRRLYLIHYYQRFGVSEQAVPIE
ncbi:substrate-binding periplasmic protein [Chitinimonas sp.]|uniref:substrate-binding periplasmic protein n=1 Tax=Chitinimonas sp. TaxID=1934313 RepID=UPI0035B18B81